MSNAQYGFVRGRGTADLLLQISADVRNSDDKYVIGILLDISSAFDNAWWLLILDSLRRRECPRNIHAVLCDYLKDRKVSLVYRGLQVSKSLSRGCPQGSVLGPHLWNVVMDSLLRLDLGENVKVYAYADDLTVLLGGNSRSAVENRANEAMARVLEWGGNSKMSFSSSKSQAILLKSSLDPRRPPLFRIRGTRIAFKKSVVILGVTVGTGLSFVGHVNKISDSARDAFMKLRRISKANWGLDCLTMRTLYRSIYEGILTYAAPVWVDELTRVTTKCKLLSAQRSPVLAVIKGYRTISTDALPVIAGVWPTDLLVRLRASDYLHKRGLPRRW